MRIVQGQYRRIPLRILHPFLRLLLVALTPTYENTIFSLVDQKFYRTLRRIRKNIGNIFNKLCMTSKSRQDRLMITLLL